MKEPEHAHVHGAVGPQVEDFDVHTDRATGEQVGSYEIEHIDFDAIVDRFLFNTDFPLATALLSAEEAAPGQLRVTWQAWKMAASLRPEAKELRLTAVAGSDRSEGGRAPVRRVPAGGYAGSYSPRSDPPVDPSVMDGAHAPQVDVPMSEDRPARRSRQR